MDRETVITHLQIIHTWAEFARERDLQFFTEKHLENIAQWADDAIVMLKEQQEQIDRLLEESASNAEMADGMKELLKEPEAAEPKITTFPKKDHDDSHIYRCGNCDMIIFKSHKYCPFCGRAVKWNE